ncbi:transposase [Selenomonas bovis]|uniref:transposase n=1 Tax=Selenomonas bovis TaxID=416586 RepID=UPI003CFF3D15
MDISSRKPYIWHLYWRNAKACYLRKHFLVFILPWGRGKIKWKEGAFADVKADRNYRRFLTKGHVNVEAETILLAMAHNIFKGTALRRTPHPNYGSSLKQNSAKNEAIGDRLFLALFLMP